MLPSTSSPSLPLIQNDVLMLWCNTVASLAAMRKPMDNAMVTRRLQTPADWSRHKLMREHKQLEKQEQMNQQLMQQRHRVRANPTPSTEYAADFSRPCSLTRQAKCYLLASMFPRLHKYRR